MPTGSTPDRTIRVNGREFALSNPDKVLFPDDGITKSDLVDYYRRVAGTALPHYRDRPVTLQRFPDGIGRDGFFQKNASDHFPDWIARARLKKEGGAVDYVVADTAATLSYLADQGTITMHLGLSRIDRIDFPDRLIFDLDPSRDDFSSVQFAARCVRAALEDRDIPSFVQTTGSRGLHVVVPLDRSLAFDDVRSVAQAFARQLAARYPDALTVEQRKAKRGDRLYLDVARNAYGQTAVAPYVVRAKAGAPVATPIDWTEALSVGMHPQKYTISNIFRRLGAKADPWATIDENPVSAKRIAANGLR